MFNLCVDDLERIHGLLFPGIYINCLLFHILLLNAATHLIKLKIYLQNMYKNLQHKYMYYLL